MVYILDLPNEILDLIFEELALDRPYEYSLEGPPLRPLMTTCQRFYRLLIPHVYASCDLNFVIDPVGVIYDAHSKDSMLTLYRRYGSFVRKLSIGVRRVGGDVDGNIPRPDVQNGHSICSIIELLLQSFTHLTTAHIGTQDQILAVQILESVRILLTRCLSLQELSLRMDYGKVCVKQEGESQIALAQVKAIDTSQAYARLKVLKLVLYADTMQFRDSSRPFLDITAGILGPSMATVKDLVLTRWTTTYAEHTPDRLWKFPSVTSVSVRLSTDTMRALNQFILLDPQKIRRLEFTRGWIGKNTEAQITDFASGFPNLETLDLPNIRPVPRLEPDEFHVILKKLKARLPGLSRIRTTISEYSGESLEDMPIVKEILSQYNCEYRPWNWVPPDKSTTYVQTTITIHL